MPQDFTRSDAAKAAKRFTPLDEVLTANRIKPMGYLRALIEGQAPPPVLIAGELYLANADLSRWQSRLLADAHASAARIIGGAQ
jgi:hypothetical protein